MVKPARVLKGAHDSFIFHGIEALKPSHPSVAPRHRANVDSGSTGSVLWHASYLLVDYLATLRNISPANQVLELGCGWGLASTYVSKRFGARVTATDCDAKALRLQNILSATNRTRVHTRQLSFSDLAEIDLSGFNLLIGSEICYALSALPQLENLMHRFAAQGGASLVLADRGNDLFFRLGRVLSRRYRARLTPVSISFPVPARGYVLHVEFECGDAQSG